MFGNDGKDRQMSQQKDFEGPRSQEGSEWQKAVVAGHVQAAMGYYKEDLLTCGLMVLFLPILEARWLGASCFGVQWAELPSSRTSH